MAFIPMKKIFIAGMNSDKESVLEDLMDAGVVQVEEFADEDIKNYKELAVTPSTVTEMNEIEDKIFKTNTAIKTLEPYVVAKKALFASKREITKDELGKLIDNQKKIFEIVNSICGIDKELTQIAADKNHIDHKIEQLSPFKKYDVPLNLTDTKTTAVRLGTIPIFFSVEELKNDILKDELAASITELDFDDVNHYISVICYKEQAQRINSLLEAKAFNQIKFDGLIGSATENIERLNNKKDLLDKQMEEESKKAAGYAQSIDKLRTIYDYLQSERSKIVTKGKLLETESVFYMRGFLPSETADKLTADLNKKYKNLITEISELEKGEEYPVIFRNNSFVSPFEVITEMYSLPGPFDVDPNPLMSIFYFVFFGLMLSDAGYGLLLSAITGFISFRYKPEGTMGKMMRMFFYCGLATTFWGILFGGWFGDLFSFVPLLQAKWINPLQEPMTLLIWSFGFGAVHLFTGMGIKAYMMIKDGKVLDAIFDVGFWYVFLIGLVMFVINGTVAKYMSIIGAIGLILTQGRHEKNIIKKFTSGIMSLYDVTSYLSDVLSYSRLLALGLATGVIANVINTMAKLGGTSAIGIIMMILILILGHTFNIAINTLGSYVHASRLQYVEFFGKFYSGGGYAFSPLARNQKYVKIKN